MTELLLVETIQPGDEVVVGRRGLHTVSEVHHYDAHDGTGGETFTGRPASTPPRPAQVVVFYFAHDEATYENKARDKSGFNARAGYIVERSLIPIDVGTLVLAERGSPATAETARALMHRQQAERGASAAQRYERMAERVAAQKATGSTEAEPATAAETDEDHEAAAPHGNTDTRTELHR